MWEAGAFQRESACATGDGLVGGEGFEPPTSCV